MRILITFLAFTSLAVLSCQKEHDSINGGEEQAAPV